MEINQFKAMTPFQQAVVLLLEKIASELTKISNTGDIE